MKRTNLFIVIVLLMSVGCGREPKENKNGALSVCETAFWGDSAVVLISTQPQNGYKISIIENDELCLFHFERGDSISRYCAIHKLPHQVQHYEKDSVGVFFVDMDFPIFNVDTLGGSIPVPEMFFMDVNFDGEEEFLVEHDGYNRKYYACFDLVNGNWKGTCPGLLESIIDEPYNNIVAHRSNDYCYTVFDRKKKEIYIYEAMGCCTQVEIWAGFVGSKIKITKRVEQELKAGGTVHIDTYELKDDTLKLVRQKNIE